MIEIDRSYAVDLLETVLSEKGDDYVYPAKPADSGPTCVYVESDEHTPSCLIGHALVAAGVDPVLLRKADTASGTYEVEGETCTVTDSGIDGGDMVPYLEDHGVHISPAALRVFARAQREQDYGVSWGTAFALATA